MLGHETIPESNVPRFGVSVTWMHGDYFATFGIPIVRGRPFTAEEQAQDRGAVMVSAAMASRFWPRERAHREANQMGHRRIADMPDARPARLR